MVRLWQTIDGIQFANVAKHIIESLCLHFAAWGSYNLKGIGQIDKNDKEKMDIEVKEVNLEEKAIQLSQKYFPDEENIWARPNIEAQNCKSACLEMVEWFKVQKGE